MFDEPDHLEKWRSGTGQQLLVHRENPECKEFGCVIHHPTDHCMRDFPTYYRYDRGLMERICPHGVGHPDPDDLAFKRRTYHGRMHPDQYFKYEAIHGCDGCCFEDRKAVK
jgi:hypothetical protein